MVLFAVSLLCPLLPGTNSQLRRHPLHRLLSLAWFSLCAEGDDGVDRGSPACGEIASEKRYEEKEQRDRGDDGEIAWGEAKEHFGD